MAVQRMFVSLFALAVLAGLAAPGFAQEGMPPMGPPEEIKKMAAEVVGDYDVVMKFKMDPTTGEWSETKGAARMYTVCDGAAVVMEFKADMMGMPMNGMSTTVYDRETKEWVETWVDNIACRMSVYRGGYDGDTLVTQGEDIMQGMKYLARNTVHSKTATGWEWKAEMSTDGGATWMTWGTAVYTRK